MQAAEKRLAIHDRICYNTTTARGYGGYSDTFYRMEVSPMDFDLIVKMIILLIILEIVRNIKK